MTARGTIRSLLLLLLGLALATSGAALAGEGLGGLPGLQLNPFDFDPGDDGVSEGPLSSGGSGAGDPWPRRVSGQPIWVRDAEVHMHSFSHPLGVVAFAWTLFDEEEGDGEIALALVNTARGGSVQTLRVTDDRDDDRNPMLLTSPRGEMGIAWERRRGAFSALAFAPLDLESATLGATRVIGVLGPRTRIAALALEGPDQPRVVIAREGRGSSLELFEASAFDTRSARGRSLTRLAAIPPESADTLELRPTWSGTLVLSWSESEALDGLLVRDQEGHWGTPTYVTRGTR